MRYEPLHEWPTTVADAIAIQRELRARLVLAPPSGIADARWIAGADASMARGAAVGYGGIVLLDATTMATVEETGAEAPLTFPYVPGLLTFREIPQLLTAWERLQRRPDVLVFDGVGYAHPRRFGLACHGGVLFGVPSVGCAKSILVGTHEPLGQEAGATAVLVHRGEVVGMALRLRAGVRPVYVSPGHLMDVDTAVRLVQRVSAGYREPETTRRAHALVNRLRREAEARA